MRTAAPPRMLKMTPLVAFVVLLTSLAFPFTPADAAPDETFADDFQTGDFVGSTGSQPWEGPWEEVGESDGAGSGTIRVDNEPHCLDEPCLLLGRDAGPDASVEREVDLSSFESASLRFDYKVHWHPPGGDSAVLSVSDDGGGSWTALDSWPLGTTTVDLVGSYDLTPYIASDTRIRFAVVGNGTDSHMNVDNLVVTGSDVPVFYTVAGSGGSGGGDDLLTAVGSTNANPATNEISIGSGTGSSGIQAAAWQPSTGILFAIDGGQLGTIDLATGTFVAKPSAVGTGNGSQGSVSMDDVVGLTFDPATGDLYGAQRRPFTQAAVMFLIDPNTGALRTGEFGGDDYVRIEPSGLNFQVADIAIDPTDGQLYAIHLSESFTSIGLATVDRSTGDSSNVGSVPDDLRGLDFDAAGRLWATTGTGTAPEQLHELNKASGASLSSIDLDNGADYEALAIPRSPVANRPPIFDQDLLDRSDPEGTLISLASPATDPDGGNTLTYSAVGLPPGIAIDPASGDITGALAGGASGVHDVVITVSDDGVPAMTDTDAFTWTVTPGEATYLVAAEGGGAGNGALLTSVDRSDGDPATNEVTIGTGIGRTNAEGASIQPGSNTLFASHRDQLGTIDVTTGVFSSLPSLAGTGNGSAGVEGFDNIEALSFDPASGDLYAIHQPNAEAMLLLLDPTTGAHVPNVFGGDDYIEVQNQGQHDRVPGMAHDPTNGTLYIVHWDNDGAADWDLATLDPATGATTRIGPLPDDLTGLSFSGDGRLFGITDETSGGTLYEIDKTDGSVNASIRVNNTDEYEAIAIAYPQLPNMPPVFDQNLPDRSDPEGTLIDITASATDPNLADTLTYSATGLPEGVMIDPATGTIGGALGPNSAGVYSVTITVVDNGTPSLSATDPFTWTVTPAEVTYLLANSGGGNGGDDLLTVADRTDANPVTNEVNIGTGTGTWNIEAAALQPGTNALFAVENDQLGTIDVTTGVFSALPSIAGAGNGSVGLVAFDNIEGLSFNPFTAELFGTHGRGAFEEDLLFKLDPATGAHVPAAFGGDDYITIESQGPYWHAADLAFDPTSGLLYLIHWGLGGQWSIATVDPATGATSTVGPAPAYLVGLAFDESGRLYATTENGLETLYELNKTNAAQISAIIIDNASDYEAVAIAFPANANTAPTFDQDLLNRTDPEGSVISLSAAASDADVGDNLSYSATDLPPGLSIHPGTGQITGTIGFTATGAYAVEILVTDDGIPNLGASDTFTWTVTEANQSPYFDQDLLDQSNAEGSVISLSAAATDPDVGDTLTYGATGLPPGLTIDTGSGLITGTIDFTAAAGSPYAVTITVTDDGSPSESATPDTFSWTVGNTNQPPTIVSPGAQTTPELAPFSITISAGDADGQIPSFSDGSTLPAWAVLTDNLDGTATIAGTPGAGDSGTTTVTVTASDGGVPNLSDDAVFDITVTNTNLPPSITNPGDQTGAEASPFSLVLTASDPDGTTVSFSDGSTLPAWATLTDNGDDTATIAGTPSYTDAAVTTVTITVSDGSLTHDAVFDLTVANTNRPPVADPVLDQTVAEDSAMTPLVVTASDPDGTIPSLAAIGLPGWATLTDNGDGSATITGTPGYTDAAISTVTIAADDGTLTGTTTFDLTVTNTNRAPTVDAIVDQSVAENDPFTLVMTSSDPDGTIPSLAATGLPGWASFVDNGDGSATITGTPGYTDAATHTVTINSEDGGTPNLSDSTTFQLTVTNTNRAPTVDPVADQSVAENNPFALALAASDPDGTIPTLAAIGLPGWAIFTDNGDGSATVTGTPGYSDAAISAVTIEADDGTLTGTATFDLTVIDSNRPPVVAPIADHAAAETFAMVPVTVTATDPDGTTPTLIALGLPSWAAFADNGDGTGTVTGTPAYGDSGVTTVTVTASDGSLSASTTFDINVTDTNEPPSFNTDQPDRSDAEGSTISLAAGASDPEGDLLTYAATGLPPGLTIDTGSGLITGTLGFDAAGTYPVQLTVTDNGTPALGTVDTFAWTVTNTNRPPVIDPIAAVLGAEGTAITFTATASDPDGDDVSYSLAGAPAGATIDPVSGQFEWTPEEVHGTGSFPVTVTATDTGAPTLAASRVVTITVTEVNRPPSIEPIGDQHSIEGASAKLVVHAADPDIPANKLTFSAEGLPTGLAIDPATGIIAGTVALGVTGEHKVTVTVTDDGSPAAAAIARFTWVVGDTNRPPLITPLLPQHGVEGDLLRFTVVADDPDGDDLSYSLNGAPAGAAIDAAGGEFTWRPTEEQGPGTYRFTVFVRDDGSPQLADALTLTVTVAERNEAPTIFPIADQVDDEGAAISIEVIATDVDVPANTLRYSATGLPAGITIDPTNGTISGTIEAGESAISHREIEITVTDDGLPALHATTVFTWTIISADVEPTNFPPTVAGIGHQYTDVDSSVNLAVDAEDIEPLRYSATGLPPGLDINSATGAITGSVGPEAVGTHRVTITVTDTNDSPMATTIQFAWTVTDRAASDDKVDLVVAISSDPIPTGEPSEQAPGRPVRRSLVVMTSSAAATTESMQVPLALLLALMAGFATVGRIGLYPVLWRGDRHTGIIAFYDEELGFGMVEPDDGGEAIFVHSHAFPRRQRATVRAGMRIRFRLLASDNRASAWGATTEVGNG